MCHSLSAHASLATDMGYMYAPAPHPQRRKQQGPGPRSPDVMDARPPPVVAPTLFNRLLEEAGVDQEDNDALRAQGYKEEDFPKMREIMARHMDSIIVADGGRIAWAGAKAEDLGNADEVVLFQIPNCPLSVRVFPGDLHPRDRMFYFDFFDLSKNKPVNSPPDFKIFHCHPLGLSSELFSGEHIISIEAAFHIAREEIKDGEERCGVHEGTCCRLERRNEKPFYFQIPVRPQPEPARPSGFATPVPYTGRVETRY
ncbi:hypothetical protein B0H10DRAFT_1919328 [Mycena sp. CBHHK59/15]|nr:hypothetical protein B0H10DRAFT_1919328 [Mycena sp. CBHHK59/15]